MCSWFDLGGMMNTLTNHEEEIINIVNMTTKVSSMKDLIFDATNPNSCLSWEVNFIIGFLPFSRQLF